LCRRRGGLLILLWHLTSGKRIILIARGWLDAHRITLRKFRCASKIGDLLIWATHEALIGQILTQIG